MLVRSSLILLLTALLLCLSTAFKTLIDVRSLTSLRSSSDDYEGFASSIMGSAAAIRQRISSRDFAPRINLKEKSIRLFEPIQVDYETSLETKDFFPYLIVAIVALLTSLLSRSVIPAQVIFTSEALFIAFCTVISTFKLNVPAFHTELETDRDYDLLWKNILDTVECPRMFFESWFLQVSFEEIRREDAYEFLCWAMYQSLSERLSLAQTQQVDRVLKMVEVKTFKKMPGSVQQGFPYRGIDEVPLRAMKASIEPLRWIQKPLFLYFLLQFVLGTANVRTTLFKDGFQIKSAGKLSYWINDNLKNYHENEKNEKNESEKINENEKINLKKNLKKMFFFKNEKTAFIPTTSSNNIDRNNGISSEVKVNVNALHPKNQKLPILFFHGIGGVFSYLKLINGFTLYGHPVVIVELPYVSLHIAPDVPSIDEHIQSVTKILDDNGYEGAIIIGHSFGTAVMSWLVQAIPHRIAGAIFLDPVVFMLHLRDISFNWMYGSVLNVGHNLADQGIADVMGIVKTELFAAHAVQRHFNWAKNILWAEEIQALKVETLVVCSAADKVVPSKEVIKHVEDFNIDMNSKGVSSFVSSEMFEEAGHGDLVFDEMFRDKALASIQQVVEKSQKSWDEKKN
mmetsp:Transcript_19248/g.18587  ORF Transcript_19248/g.18587 Transcript_19248/m.18587 type:complete len:626 (-) Transcript_19248:185-2062(-)